VGRQSGLQRVQSIGNGGDVSHWISWINNPLRSFGSIQVLLGGKNPP
jgi:hypothetical protein